MADKTVLEELQERAEAIKAKASGSNNEPVAEESAIGDSATGETVLEQLKKRADAIKAKASTGGTATGSQESVSNGTALEELKKRAQAIRNKGTVKDKPMMAAPSINHGTPGAASQEQVRSWVDKSMALMKDAESYYGNWSGKDGNRDEEIRKTAVGLMRELSSVKAAYTGNQEAVAAIDGITQNLLNVYKGTENARKYYSQWESQEAYDEAVAEYDLEQQVRNMDAAQVEAEVKIMEDQLKDLQRRRSIEGNFYLTGSVGVTEKGEQLEEQIRQLEEQLQGKKKLLQKAQDMRTAQEQEQLQQEALKLDMEKAAAEIRGMEANLEHLKNLQTNTFDKEKLAQLAPQIDQMEKTLREKKNLYQTAQNLQGQRQREENRKQLEAVSGNADFKANSGYDASYGQEGVHDPHTYEAMEYDHINGETSDVSDRYFKDKHYDQMEPEEVAVYNYYFKTQGIKAAKAYLDSLQETLNARYAKDAMKGYQGKTGKEILFGVKAGWDQAMTGLKNLDQMILNTIKGEEGGYITPTGTQMLGSMIRQDLDKNAGKLATVGYDIINTTANMLPSILVSTAVGLTATPGVGSTVGAAMMGGGAAGNAYQEALNIGFSQKEAAAYGTAIGISEAALERVLGGIGKLGGTSAKIANAVSGIENGIARFCLQWGGKIGSEALEEGLQSVLEPGISNWLLDTDKDVDWSEVAYSALLGGLTGGVFGVVDLSTEAVAGKVVSHQQAKNVGQWLIEKGKIGAEDVQAIVESGLESPQGTESHSLAEAAQKKLESGKTLEDAELGRLYLANVEQVKKEDAQQLAAQTQQTVETARPEQLPEAVPVTQTHVGFVGSSGLEYNPKQAELLGALGTEAIQNAADLYSKRDVTFNDLGISDTQTRQAWMDAGLAYEETSPSGEKYVAVHSEPLMDERARRQSQKASAPMTSNADQMSAMNDMQTKNELYRQMVQQNQNGGNANANTYGQAGADGTAAGAGLLYGGGQRNVGTSTGESTGSMVGGTESAAQRTERLTGASRIKAAIARQNLARSLRLQKLSSQEIGLTRGTEKRNLQVLPQENWDSELQALAQKVREETGKEAVFVVGEIYVKGADGKDHRVRAAITDGNVILQADYSKTPLDKLLDHEIYHYKYAEVRENGHNLDNMNKLAILEQFSQEEYMAVLDAYMAALDGQYGLSEAKQLSTDDAYKKAVALIRQEMMADAYAGINAFGAGADKFTKAVKTRTDQLKYGKKTAQENGVRQTNGPNAEHSMGEKYSSAGVFSEEAKAFAEDVQQWNKNGRDIAAPAFILGSTGDVLQGLGAIESDIYMLPEKINRILQDHPEMTPEIIQKIPQILEDPILILKSRNVGGGKHQNTRLVIFGAVKATDGRPVMSVLDLRPVENNLVIDDMQKVSSAYTKDNNPISFIRDSDVLHADEKRTAPLLRTIGFQMPIELQQSGSIGSISYQGQNVKLWGEKFTDVVRESEPTQNTNGEEWISVFDLPFNEQVEAMAQGRYDNETKRVRVNKSEHYSTDDEGVEVIKSDKEYELDEEEYRRVKSEMAAKEKQWREDFLNNELGEKGAERYRATQRLLDFQEKAERAQKAKEDRTPVKEVELDVESRATEAKRLLENKLLQTFSIPDGMRGEMRAYIDGFADRIVKHGALTEDDRSMFFARMYEAGAVAVPADHYYGEARSYIKGGHIFVPEGVRAEFGSDWQDIRRRAFAAGIYLNYERTDKNGNSISGIDAWNRDLAAELPGLFDEEDTDAAEILQKIIHVAEQGKEDKISLAEYVARVAKEEYISEDDVLDSMERQMRWALESFAETAKVEIQLKDRNLRRVLKERKENQERAQRAKERRELQELQQKTLKSLQWLNKNRRLAPEELREEWDRVLSDIDLYAVGAANEMNWSNKYQATWRDLAAMYKDAQKNDPNFHKDAEIERIISRLEDKKIEDMDPAMLTDLYKLATGLRTAFYNRNNVLNDKKHRLFQEVYIEATEELEAAGKKKEGSIDRFFNREQLSAMNVLERMAGWNPDSAWYSMAQQLERGERDVRAYTVEANRILEDYLNEHKDFVMRADGQGKDAIWYTIEVPELTEWGKGNKPIFGDTVTVYMTPAQKVHMYLESKNLDNLRHMEGGRTFVVDKELYGKGKRQEALEQGRTIRLAPETVKQLVSNLTEEEMELARVLDQYYNGYAPEKINRVSNELYGYDKAMGKHYAPIFTNQNYTNAEFGTFDVTAEGVGNLKGRVEYSKTPSYNISAFDAFERNVSQTARFVGMAIPIRNWETLMNWTEYKNSMKDTITHSWGLEHKRYIERLLTDIQGGKIEENDAVNEAGEKLLSNYISSVFGANMGIVLKQMGSIPLAGAYLGIGNVVPGRTQVERLDRALIGKYTQDLAWRGMGYSMPETKQLKDHPNWTQRNKVARFALGGGAITAMDQWAASTLWPWAENKVRKEHPELEVGTQEQINNGESPFYKKVAEEFENAVARSQSTSDQMHQGTLRKSKKTLTRMFTMFTSDSAQTYNTLRQMLGEHGYYKRSGQKKKAGKAARAAAAAVTALLLNALWGEGVNLLAAMIKNKGKKYRDEEGEMTALSILEQMGMGMLSSLAGTVIGGDSLVDMIASKISGEKYYTPESMEVSLIQDMFKTADTSIDIIFGTIADMVAVGWNGGDIGEYFKQNGHDILGRVKDAALEIASYWGIPAANVEAYIMGALKYIPGFGAVYDGWFESADKSALGGLTGKDLTIRVGSLLDQHGVETTDETAEALAGLYEAGYSGVVPGAIPTKVTIEGEENELNLYQQQVYGNIWGSIVAEHLEKVVSSELFEGADAKMQSKLIQALYSYADAKAKDQLFDDYELSGSIKGMDDALKSGLSMEKVLDLKVNREKEEAGTGTQGYTGKLKDYMEMVENGVDPDEAHAIIEQMEQLEPEEGKTSVSNLQECMVIANYPWQESMKEDALKAIMSDSGYEKYMSCRDAGVLTYWYFTFLDDTKDMKTDYDANGKAIKGASKKDKVVAAIDGYERLTPKQKDALFLTMYAESGLRDCPWN